MAHSNALIKKCWTTPEHVCSRVPVHRPHHHSILQGRAHLGNGVSFTHLVDPKIDSRAPGPHKAPPQVPRNPWLLSIPSPQSVSSYGSPLTYHLPPKEPIRKDLLPTHFHSSPPGLCPPEQASYSRHPLGCGQGPAEAGDTCGQWARL